MKHVLIFLAAFLFVQLIGVYIMGGFYSQTIESKAITSFAGIFLGAIAYVIYYGITYKNR